MLDRDRNGNLLRLRRAGSDGMAFGARDALAKTVVRMAKNGLEYRPVRLCPAVWRARIVAFVTGTDLAVRCMARKTRGMRTYSGRDRLGGTLRLVAGRAAGGRQSGSLCMGGVIKFHVERLIELRRKSLHRRGHGLQIIVAHYTDSRFTIRKFIQMTTDAGIVCRKP